MPLLFLSFSCDDDDDELEKIMICMYISVCVNCGPDKWVLLRCPSHGAGNTVSLLDATLPLSSKTKQENEWRCLLPSLKLLSLFKV